MCLAESCFWCGRGCPRGDRRAARAPPPLRGRTGVWGCRGAQGPPRAAETKDGERKERRLSQARRASERWGRYSRGESRRLTAHRVGTGRASPARDRPARSPPSPPARSAAPAGSQEASPLLPSHGSRDRRAPGRARPRPLTVRPISLRSRVPPGHPPHRMPVPRAPRGRAGPASCACHSLGGGGEAPSRAGGGRSSASGGVGPGRRSQTPGPGPVAA